MRSYILVILSALVLGGLFVFVWTMQPQAKQALKEPVRTAPPELTNRQGYGPIKPGELVWIKQYDRNGQLSSRFSGDQYLPQADGTVKVTNPRAEFFLANHQRLQVEGVDGNVVMKDVPTLTPGSFGGSGPPAPPSRGRLNQVTVKLVDEVKNLELLTMTTNNVVFDNETFRIVTEGYKSERGQTVEGDQVPVHVTGQMKLEGRGLIVRWNDKDGRLELLEITHGDVLEITDPSSFSLGGAKTTTVRPAPPTARSRRPFPEMLVDAGTDAAVKILTHHPVATAPPTINQVHGARASIAPIYRASFSDNVRINQLDPDGKGDQIRIDHVDRMDVNFLMKESNSASATQPAPVAPAQSATQPQPAAIRPAPASQPAAPAPQKEPPMFIHWTGTLRITPEGSTPPVPLQPGDSSVLLTGAPVNVHRVDAKSRETEDVHCATVLYATTGERVWLGKSPACPQILIDKFPAAGAKEQEATHLVSLGEVEYAGTDGKAVLIGPGNALVPLEPDPKTPHPQLNAAWTKQANFDFSPGAAGKQSSITSGHFEGDVDVRHPKLTLQSQSLDLLFDPAAKSIATGSTNRPTSSQPNLREMIATTGVYCEVEGADGKKEKIKTDRLVLDTDKSEGKLYARQIHAIGHAHAFGEDDLQAGTVDLWLNPAKKKPAGAKKKTDDDSAQVELEKMVAHENVIALSKDGSRATGDDLVVTSVDGQQHTVLTSRTNASVTDVKGNVVNGKEIQFDSSDGKAHVVGPGSLRAVQQASATQPAQPVDVAWTNWAIFDGGANHVDVDGAVKATSIDKKGFVDVATGHHVHIDLRAKPTTQPTGPAVASTSDDASAAPAPAGAGGKLKMDPFKGKEVSAMTIQDEAKLTSTLSGEAGAVLQQFELEGPTILINEFAADGTPARTITVPAAGKMLARDHRPKVKQATATGGNEEDSSGARGATAFQWHKQLIYKEADHRSDMTGQVVVVHQDDDPSSPPVRMICEHVISWFEAAPKHPATGKQGGEDSAQMQLRYLSAEGNPVVVTRDTDQVVARQVDYNPKTHVLIATGTQQNPVSFTDGSAAGGVAERIEWDTITWKIKARNAIFDDRPAVPGVQTPPAQRKKPLPGAKQ